MLNRLSEIFLWYFGGNPLLSLAVPKNATLISLDPINTTGRVKNQSFPRHISLYYDWGFVQWVWVNFKLLYSPLRIFKLLIFHLKSLNNRSSKKYSLSLLIFSLFKNLYIYTLKCHYLINRHYKPTPFIYTLWHLVLNIYRKYWFCIQPIVKW